MPTTRTFAIVCAISLVGMIAMGPVTALLGISLVEGRAQIVGIAVLLTLFVVFGLSAIALMVKLVLAGHVQVGNADVGVVRAMRSHETGIIVSFWAVILLGMTIAIPAAILDGAFGPEAAESVRALLPSSSK
jgi:hypothetical protein